jgi:hypothetical protein
MRIDRTQSFSISTRPSVIVLLLLHPLDPALLHLALHPLLLQQLQLWHPLHNRLKTCLHLHFCLPPSLPLLLFATCLLRLRFVRIEGLFLLLLAFVPRPLRWMTGGFKSRGSDDHGLVDLPLPAEGFVPGDSGDDVCEALLSEWIPTEG